MEKFQKNIFYQNNVRRVLDNSIAPEYNSPNLVTFYDKQGDTGDLLEKNNQTPGCKR